LLEGLLKWGELQILGIHNMIIEDDLDLIIASNNIAGLVFFELEINILPNTLHLLKHILNLEFLKNINKITRIRKEALSTSTR